jgi:hypothetical protein
MVRFMRARGAVASIAALVALLVVASPVLADNDYRPVGTVDWLQVVIFSALGLFAFYLALNVANRGR